MGQHKSVLAHIEPLDNETASSLCSKFGFTRDELDQLHHYYRIIAGSVEDDGLIDMQEFQAALGFSNSIFAARIFHALDEDSNATLEFSEFVRGFYLLSTRASKAEKIQFTFKIYDIDGNGAIQQEELLQLLTDVVHEDSSTRHLQLTEEHLRDWVDVTFKEVCRDGSTIIGLDEYTRMVEKHPAILDALTIPLNFLHAPDSRLTRRKTLQTFEKSFLSKDAVSAARANAQHHGHHNHGHGHQSSLKKSPQ